MKFYTNVTQRYNKFLVRGYENGQRFTTQVDYQPTLYIPSNKKTDVKTLDGKYVLPINPGTPEDCKKFFQKYVDVDGFEIYGMDNYVFQFISDNYPEEKIEYDITKIKIYIVDIEVSSENGFPSPLDCIEEILSISIQDFHTKKITCFGVKEYNNRNPDVNYILCNSEIDLCYKFLQFWESDYPDIITGWNTNLYDIPYIVGRFNKILGEKETSRLSPWGRVHSKELEFSGRLAIISDIIGIASIDYIDLYKKFTYVNQESYALNHICEVELNEKKLDHSEFETFKDFYTKDWNKFIDYNIQDVILVGKLEQKLKLLELSIMMAFNAKVNFSDVFFQVRMWDAITFNYLKAKNIAIPPRNTIEKTEKFKGAYVKEPIPGMYEYVVSFDLASLYPSLIMMYNISPETLVDVKHPTATIERILNKESDTESYSNYTICPNGCMYRKDIQGFFPKLVEEMFGRRKQYKSLMLKAEQEYEKNPSVELENKIAEYHNIQQNLKICLNSLYGALGNSGFRYYRLDNAKAITFSGQVTIKWIERKLNRYLNKVSGTDNFDYVIALDTDSVVGDSIITINGKSISIEDFYNSIDDNYLKYDEFNCDFVKSVSNKTTISLSKFGDLEEKNIKYVMKHKVKKKLYKIRVGTDEVVITEDHSIIVKEKSTNIIKSIKPKELSSESHFIINIIGNDTDTDAG